MTRALAVDEAKYGVRVNRYPETPEAFIFLLLSHFISSLIGTFSEIFPAFYSFASNEVMFFVFV